MAEEVKDFERAKTLAGRIAKISSEIGAISKSGRNAQQGYAYIEYAQVAAELRILQEKHGVAVIPQVEKYTQTEVRNSKGGIGYHYLLGMEFTIVNTDDGADKLEIHWMGEATDFGDKGINKAITSAVKYFLMRLYNISEKNEKEADAETPEQRAPKVQKNRPEQKIDYPFLCKVRGKLPTINTNEELESYWKSLNLNQTYQGLLKKDFAKRRGEINGVAG